MNISGSKGAGRGRRAMHPCPSYTYPRHPLLGALVLGSDSPDIDITAPETLVYTKFQ